MIGTASKPLISVITPSLNQVQFLWEALESVHMQRFPSVEHLVLDGGSTDGSVDLLERFDGASTIKAFWWRSCKDGGQSAALNEGFARASGDIVGWLNADDRYRHGCFEAVADAFAQNPDVDVIYGDYTFVDQAGAHRTLRREIEFSHFILRYHRVLYIPTTTTFFRRRIFDNGEFLDNSLHYAMDLEFFLRLADKGYKFLHLPKVLADFRIHPASKSVAFLSRQRAEHRSVILSATPLRRIRPMCVREFMADLLQVPAKSLRYFEKLMRGYYFPAGRHKGAKAQSAETRGKA